MHRSRKGSGPCVAAVSCRHGRCVTDGSWGNEGGSRDTALLTEGGPPGTANGKLPPRVAGRPQHRGGVGGRGLANDYMPAAKTLSSNHFGASRMSGPGDDGRV
jgi:hypothetical protein